MPRTNGENLLALGQEMAGCRVVEFLGAGGMGQVYKCEHLRLQKPVALKILPALDSKSIKRFLREARSAAKIDHPNVVIIHDVDQDRVTKLYFIIMQLINGRNLAQLVEAHAGPIPWRQAVKLVRGAAKGAAAVHAQGLIHRDIKPANIMFSTVTRQAILMDFGLVREIEPSDWQVTAGAAGTPMFMSPEQCRGSAHLDPRSDIVSLGRTLYFLLTGRLPYGQTDPSMDRASDIMHQIVSGRVPTPVHQLNPAVPPEVSRLVERAMAHDPTRRFQTASELVGAMDRLQKIPDLPGTVSYHFAPANAAAETVNDLPELELITDDSADRSRRPKKWLVAAGGLGTCLVLLLAWILNRPPGKRDLSANGEKEATDASSMIALKSDASKMVRIPAGKVHVGNSETTLRKHAEEMAFDAVNRDRFIRLGRQKPEALLGVPTFWIDKYEVTNGEYAKFVQHTNCAPPVFWIGGQLPKSLADHPVVGVSHADALAYAAWAKKKLPTDAQWLRVWCAPGAGPV